tara:strand:+ start:734 stop:2437 length:1704 start_codon:yes stop_codon:yes gene_type:complete
MKSVRILLLIAGTMVLLSALVNAPREYNPELAVRYSRDLAVLLCAVIATARFRLAPVVAGLATVLWTAAMAFEWVRSVGVTAMSQEPLLYDAFFLVGHLFNLMNDLMGTKAKVIVGGVVLSLVVTVAVTGWLFRRIQLQGRVVHLGTRLFAAVLVIGTGVGVERFEIAEGKNSLIDASNNIVESMAIREEIQRGISPKAYKDIRDLRLNRQPSVHIYIVESYGNGIRRRSIRDEYYAVVDRLEEQLVEAGWSARTGLSEAPVMGGRSWLADATLLSGRMVKYESVYRHLMPHLSSITTLPGFFKANGYETILMRHNDRERPGLPIRNFFGFEHTIHQLDVNYKGPAFGWAGIPDQFALGHLRDEVLPAHWDSPHFVFAHLASSHIPWDDVPPLLDDWRALNDERGSKTGVQDAPLTEKQIKYQLKRFKRKETVRLRRLKPSAENIKDYLRSVSYSIEAVVQHLLLLKVPPDIVVIMGDHQPPLYRSNTDFSVPIHVLSRDSDWLREFRKRGFRWGMRPPNTAKRIRHEGFFSIMTRALARAQDLPMPRYRSNGIKARSGGSERGESQ